MNLELGENILFIFCHVVVVNIEILMTVRIKFARKM